MYDYQQSVSVALLGQNNLVREGLRRIIERDEFCICLSEDVKTFLARNANLIHENQVFIFDPDQLKKSDIQIAFAIRNRYPNSKLVVLDTEFSLENMIDVFGAGADGYILKNVACESLLGLLRLVCLGEKVMPSALVNVLPQYVSRARPPAVESKLAEILSERELETLRCLCRGDPNKVIAQHLGISEATVKVHVKAILRKLNLRNRTQAVAWMYRAGIELDVPQEKYDNPQRGGAVLFSLAKPMFLAA